MNDPNNILRDLPSSFILLGDFNGQHPLWGDCTTNSRGILLASFIDNVELEALNSGKISSLHIYTETYTAIDISLCSSDVLLYSNLRILPDLYGSDHFPVLLVTVDTKPRSRNFSKFSNPLPPVLLH